MGQSQKWTTEERLELLNSFSKENDWSKRSEVMKKELGKCRPDGFFSPDNCSAEYQKILSETCPGFDVHEADLKAGYSTKVVVEKWISHLEKKLAEEDDRKLEECNVETRKMTILLENLLNGKYTESEMEELMERMNLEEEEILQQDLSVKSDMADLMSQTYTKKAKEVLAQPVKKPLRLPRLAASKSGKSFELVIETPEDEELINGPKSPIKSPFVSPIRSVTDLFENPSVALAYIKGEDATPTTTTKSKTMIKEKSEEKPEIAPESTPSRSRNKASKTESTPQLPSRPTSSSASRTGQRHQQKQDSEAPSESSVSTSTTTTTNTTNAESKSKKHSETESTKRSRKSTSTNNTKSKAKRDDSTISVDDVKREIDSPMNLSKPPTPIPRLPPSPSHKEVACQTRITITSPPEQPSLATKNGKKSSAATPASSIPTPLRKSSRRSEAKPAAASSTTEQVKEQKEPKPNVQQQQSSVAHQGVQTGRVEMEKDCSVIYHHDPHPVFFHDIVSLDQRRGGERRAVQKLSEGVEPMVKVEEEEPEPFAGRRSSKSDHKKEISYVVDATEAVGNALIAKKNYKPLESAGESPAKRPRKDEKSRDELTNIKYQFINVIRALIDHRHSTIFSAPVTERDAPGYAAVVYSKMDLTTLKKELDNGSVTNQAQFYKKAYNIFANAVMFNCSGHDVNTSAKAIVKDVLSDSSLFAQSIDEKKRPVGRRSRAFEESKIAESSTELEPRPVAFLGDPGDKRRVFKKPATVDKVKKVKVPKKK